MAMNLAPYLKQQFFDNNGDPLAGGKVYTYQSGTTTPQATYTDSGGLTANANPIILDSAGEAAIWLDPTLSYKVVVKTSADTTLRTVDNIIGLLSVNTVGTDSLVDLAVTTAKIADDAVTAAKLRDDASVDGNRAVTTNHIRDAGVTRAKLATGAVAKLNIVAKTAAYTLVPSTDDGATGATAGGAFSLTLPDLAANEGKVFYIAKTDTSTNALTVARAGSDTFVGGGTSITLTIQGESYMVVAGSSNWLVF